eukprot:1409779-Amphidinium_carterae.1
MMQATGSPSLRTEIEQELQLCRSSRTQLRATAPAPKRLQGLQCGSERRREKVTKLNEKRAEIQLSYQSFEADMTRAIEGIRTQYMNKKKELEGQLEENQQQRENALEELAELKTCKRFAVCLAI